MTFLTISLSRKVSVCQLLLLLPPQPLLGAVVFMLVVVAAACCGGLWPLLSLLMLWWRRIVGADIAFEAACWGGRVHVGCCCCGGGGLLRPQRQRPRPSIENNQPGMVCYCVLPVLLSGKVSSMLHPTD
jgi:hypothetical protein